MGRIILIFFFLLAASNSYADIFDRVEPDIKSELKKSIDKDSRGYSYGASVDWNLTSPKNNDVLDDKISVSGSLGCSGFNFNENFLHQFKAQALTNAVTDLAKNAMAASPMLLLEYASPTLADVVKHFSTSANLKLGFLYAQCEDIEKEGGAWVDKLRKKSENNCKDTKMLAGEDLETALKECKAQADPFSFLKNTEGKSLVEGGEINILDDILKNIKLNQAKRDEILKHSPVRIITASSVENRSAKENIGNVFDQNRDNFYSLLLDNFNKYARNPNSLTQEDFNAMSLPGVPFTTNTLDNLVMLDKNDRQIKLSQLATSLGRYKTIMSYRDYINQMNIAKLDTRLDDVQVQYADSLVKYYEDSIKTMDVDSALQKDNASILEEAITETDRRKLRALTQLNTSDKYKETDKSTADKGMLMLEDE